MVSAELSDGTTALSSFEERITLQSIQKHTKLVYQHCELIQSGFMLQDEKNDSALAKLIPDAAFSVDRELAASVTSPTISNVSS